MRSDEITIWKGLEHNNPEALVKLTSVMLVLLHESSVSMIDIGPTITL